MEVFSLAVKLKEEGAAAVDAALKKLQLSSVLTAAAIGTGLAVALNKMAQESAAAQAAQAQLEAAIRSTGGVAGQTADALNTHAAALQSMTAFADDAVTGAQALLLTFTQVRGETFTKATEAILDVATAMGTDLKSAAIQVGKALNDPILGVSALARSGIQFSESQKAMIKSLVDTGRLAEAQAIILKELETQFGGSAAAARDTLGGALAALNNAFGDLFEVSSSGMRPVIDGINSLANSLGMVRDAFGAVVPLAKGLALAFAAPIIAAFAQKLNAIRIALVAQIAAQRQTIAMARLEASAAASRLRALTALNVGENQLTQAKIRAQMAARNLAVQTSVLSRSMVAASAAAQTMWAAIGGPIGLVLISIAALQAAMDKYLDTQDRAIDKADQASASNVHYQAAVWLSKRRTEEAASANEFAGMSAQTLGQRITELTRRQQILKDELKSVGTDLVGQRVVLEALDAVTRSLTQATEEQTRANEAARDSVNQYRNNLVQLAASTALTQAEFEQLVRAEQAVSAQLNSGNVPLARRVELLQQQKALSAAIVSEQLERLTPSTEAGSTVRPTLAVVPKVELKLPPTRSLIDPAGLEKAQAAINESADQIRDTLAESLGNSIGDGIAAGFERGFATGKIGEGFKALAGTLLSGFGSMLIQFGQAALAASTIMTKIRTSLASLNPVAGAAAAIALIALGGTLKGAAQAAFGSTGGGGGASAAVTPVTPFGIPMTGQGSTNQIIFGQTSATTAAGMTPRSATNVTIIGPDDPKAQRAIQELISKGNTRGTLG